MLLIDPDTGGIEDCSPGACSFYGYNKEDLTTKKLTEINTLPPEQLFENIQAAWTEQPILVISSIASQMEKFGMLKSVPARSRLVEGRSYSP